MRTLMIMNSLATGLPTAKGDTAFLHPNTGAVMDLVTTAAMTGNNAMMDVINSLGNGSTKQFSINPFNFTFRSELSGSATSIVPLITVAYPTAGGNVITDSFTNQFVGGIIVKLFNKDKNVFNTKAIIPVSFVGASTSATVNEAVAAFKVAMANITGSGKYAASVSHTSTTSSAYTLTDTNTYIELVGDLRNWVVTKTQGLNLANTGVDILKFERELAANSGYHFGERETELFATSNFITDTTAVYDIVTIETMMEAQRPLLPNAAGFAKTLHIAIPHTAVAEYNKLIDYLGKLQSNGGAAIAP